MCLEGMHNKLDDFVITPFLLGYANYYLSSEYLNVSIEELLNTPLTRHVTEPRRGCLVQFSLGLHTHRIFLAVLFSIFYHVVSK